MGRTDGIERRTHGTETDACDKTYGTKTAVDHINMTLREGIYGLLGANGAGKTSLMRLVCLIQKRSGGEITLDGREIQEMGEEYRSLLGYLPQNFGYYPEFTAQKFLLYMSALKGLNKHAAKRRIEELLDVTGLTDDRNRKIKNFFRRDETETGNCPGDAE